MKKYTTMFFFLIFAYSATLHAQFVFTPKTGYLNTNIKDEHGHYFDISLDAMYVFKNGFTIMSAYDFPIVGSETKHFGKYPIKKGNFVGSLMFGYTYSGIENLYITTVAGMSTNFDLMSSGYLLPLGIGLQFETQYYFAPNFGFSFALKTDQIFMPYLKHSGFDFLNVNTLKMGIAFRL